MEATKTKMNMDGTIRAKVLQYKSDGNTLTEKWHTLTKFAEGIYLSYAAPDKYEQVYVTVVFAKNGVFWKVGCELEQCFRPDSFHYAEHVETLKKRYANYEAGIMQAVANGGWLTKLHITVMERLGYDTTAMIEAYNEVRRQREERDRQQAEEAERRERERMKAEERRKAEVLEDGKEKLLNHERITVEQIELIAETEGYKINIRTIGFMREKVTEVVMLDNDRVQVFGYKLTSRNIDGTAKVMHELYDQLKVQAEEETKQAATLTETPRISTETAKMANVSAKEGRVAETANYSLPVEADENAPQSPETPQTVKHTTRVYKPREMVRKLPKSVIRNCRTTHVRQKLGVQGYSMLADASATLAVINAPPIRGDCKIGISQRAKPPNCASREKVNILQPP